MTGPSIGEASSHGIHSSLPALPATCTARSGQCQCLTTVQAEYEVVARSSAAASAVPSRSRKPERTPSPPSMHPDHSDAFSPRTATNGLHDSFMADAVKLRDAWRSTAQVRLHTLFHHHPHLSAISGLVRCNINCSCTTWHASAAHQGQCA